MKRGWGRGARGWRLKPLGPTPAPREAAEASVASDVGVSGFSFPVAFCFLGSGLAHGLTAQLDAMSVVHQPVKDAVGDRGVADLLVPLGDGNL